MFDRFWWWIETRFGGKPTKNKPMLWMVGMGGGIGIGMLIGAGLINIFTDGEILGTVICLAGALLFGILLYKSDKAEGYVDALYAHYLKRREKLRKKFGGGYTTKQ